eukprot:Stramenopile-MAST_4_protein_5649
MAETGKCSPTKLNNKNDSRRDDRHLGDNVSGDSTVEILEEHSQEVGENVRNDDQTAVSTIYTPDDLSKMSPNQGNKRPLDNDIKGDESKKPKIQLYIRVMKSAPGFRGKRVSIPVDTFDVHNYSPTGLIIPQFSRSPLGNCKKNEKEYPESGGYPTDTCIRYQGLLDMDLDIKVFTVEVIAPFQTAHKSSTEAKNAIADYVRKHGLRAFVDVCPPFKRLYDVCETIVSELNDSNCDPLLFYTGGKGFCIFWHDPKLYQVMGFDEQSHYANELIGVKFPQYFRCWELMAPYVDKKVYEK